jgi:regulator of protease activity HflC (stomatin/prohibitin superfamily)
MNNTVIDLGKDFGKKEKTYTTVLLMLVAAVVLVFQSFHVVPPGHRGISVTLGKVDPAQRPEGLAFKKPFIQKILNFPIMQLKDDGRATSFSSDLQNIDFSYTILYRIPEDRVVTLYQQYRGDPYRTLVEPRVQEVIKQVTSLSRAEDLVKKREQVKTQSIKRLREAIGDIIYIADLAITNIDLSDQLEHAIEEKVVREQEALAKTFELEKEKKQAEITIVRAEAEAKSVQIKGEALKTSPEVIQLEIAQRWDGKAPLSVSIGDSGKGASVLLPLK